MIKKKKSNSEKYTVMEGKILGNFKLISILYF